MVGHSMVVDPWETPLAGGGDEECIVKTKIDIQNVFKARENFPAFSDRVLID